MTRCFLFLGLVFISFSVKAQDYLLRDFESWWNAGVNYKHNKFINVAFDQNLRFNEGSGDLQQYFTEIKLSLEPINKLDFDTEIRMGIKNGEILNHNFFRYRFNLSYKIDFGKLEITPRIGYQNRTIYRWPFRNNDLNVDMRYKVEALYKIKNWKADPCLSFEIFRHLNANKGPSWDRFRIRLSTEIKTSKKSEIDVFCAYENEMGEDTPLEVFFVGTAFTFKVKRKVKMPKE
ncbi:MAG: DUF2490 domain-containing protein [Bacteroidia bacterium]